MNALVTASTAQSPALTSDAGTRQFLTFDLAGETCALAIDRIKEIIEYERPTKVPQMPAFVRGVINLRGAVVPVIDLSRRFGGQLSASTRLTCVVILELKSGDNFQLLGALVDAVHEVIELPAGEIAPAPSLGARIRSQFIAGVAKCDSGFVILLDIDRVLSIDELAQLDDAISETEAML